MEEFEPRELREVRQPRIRDQCSFEMEPSQAGDGLEILDAVVAHRHFPQIKAFQVRQALQLREASVGDLSAVQIERQETGKILQMLESRIGNLCVVQDQGMESNR